MRLLRKILLPVSLLYGWAMLLRNELYDRKILKSTSFGVPVISVGNLSVGGTGKSPMVEYLISLLKDDYRVATLSRGYKRSTQGFHLLKGDETALEVGDEPLQFKTKFPEVPVAVDEKRVHGIESLLSLENPPEIILLDDAFQHRKVAAGFYIILTPYNNLYIEDYVLPTGNLREPRSGAKRAQVVVVTKCPPDLGAKEKDKIREKLRIRPGQELYFSKIVYSTTAISVSGNVDFKYFREKSFTLITGIANPGPLVEFLKEQGLSFEHLSFPDHHNFTGSEIKLLQSRSLVLTTEKDFMRLKKSISREKLFYLPIKTELFTENEKFEKRIKTFVTKK